MRQVWQAKISRVLMCLISVIHTLLSFLIGSQYANASVISASRDSCQWWNTILYVVCSSRSSAHSSMLKKLRLRNFFQRYWFKKLPHTIMGFQYVYSYMARTIEFAYGGFLNQYILKCFTHILYGYYTGSWECVPFNKIVIKYPK